MKFMKTIKEQSNTTNGVFNLFVTVVLSSFVLGGCVNKDDANYKPEQGLIMLTENQLNHFKIDCNDQQRQIEFLQSQRVDTADVVNSWIAAPFNGFQPAYSKRRNWFVDFLITEIRSKCNG